MPYPRVACLLIGLFGLLGGAPSQARAAAEKTPLQSVDPTIGTTHCRWFFFTPGAMPFGMAKPGPCTDAHLGNAHGWDAVGYDSRHDSIESFVSFREFQIGGVALMATTGELRTVPGKLGAPGSGYRSRFDAKDQVAQPGYYAVLLQDYGIRAELTATPRVAFHRFTFPQSDNAHVLIDVGNRQGESGAILDAFVQRSGEREVEGFVHALPVYVKGYQPGASVRMYFVARLSKTPASVGAFRGKEQLPDRYAIQGPGAGLFLNFSTAEGERIEVQLGMSYTSVANARLNLETEAAQMDFDTARTQAQARWSELLGRIDVRGGREADRVKFYTGLYHALAGRGLVSDVNGAYPKNDGSVGQIPLTPQGVPRYGHYNSDSVWGSFWNLTQLWALAYPEYLSEYVQCHLQMYRDCGWLPDSVAAGKFVSGVGTNFMGLVVSSAHAWGIRDYDVAQAYAAVLKNELSWQNRPLGVGKADVRTFIDRGYVPLLRKVPGFSGSTAEGSLFSASHTLEYSFSAFAAAQFARALGKTDDCERLLRYSRGWENLYDPATGFIRPKDQDGKFIADFEPRKPWIGFQEGNAWQYTFYVPHDPEGLMQKMGRDTFRQRLADVFAQAEKTGFGGGKKIDAFSGLENVYNHGNQPSLHIAWLFNYAGQPELTRHWVRRICDEFYGTDAVHGYGYGQDEDQGQLGAWFVLAGIGLFDVQGGTSAEPVMQIGAPLFERIQIELNPRYYPGKRLQIVTRHLDRATPAPESAQVNGTPLPQWQVPWKTLVAGAELELSLTVAPRAPTANP
ncbi:MAG: glycoside hydrolase family 92 protein [Opitutae bacterium]|nr:glycoside hydrolase family 92 protein [Opitutae bacterium]